MLDAVWSRQAITFDRILPALVDVAKPATAHRLNFELGKARHGGGDRLSGTDARVQTASGRLHLLATDDKNELCEFFGRGHEGLNLTTFLVPE